ncbi:hypothetical protein ABT279_44795 [Amycolatopsis sp. NPDC000673]|uniref:hypothetical protein n=1 Tax=Amycolatopsis TaxID=1813 RepID=UPI0031DD5D01
MVELVGLESEVDALGDEDDDGWPPVELLPGGGFGVEVSDGGVVTGSDVVDVGGGLTVCEGDVVVPPPGCVGVSLRSEVVPGGGTCPPPGCPPGWPAFGGGVITLVVGFPSGPTATTVVGVGGAVWPGVGEPGTVIGPPGTALPGTTTCELPCSPPWPPPVLFVAVSVTEPGPASSATAAKAVATTSPLTPRMA